MDCGDNSCVFALARGGMRTNGGCRCLDGVAVELRRELQSYVIGVRRDRDTLREQLAVVTGERDELRLLSESRRRLYDSAVDERDEALSAIYDYLTGDEDRVKELEAFESLMVKHAYHVPGYDAALSSKVT